MTELKQTIRYCKAPDGRAIAWSTMGNGPPLVVFAGLGHLEVELRSGPWSRMYRELAQRHTLVRYDGRGSGLSDRDFCDFTLEQQLEDAISVVDAARLDRFSIYTTLMGSLQAIECAARYASRVDKLVIYGGFSRGFLHRDPSAEQVALREALYNALEAGWDDQAFRMLNSRQALPGGNREEHESMAMVIHAVATARVFIGGWRWQAQTDVSDSARKLTCPTLVLHARQDARIPFDEGRRTASIIPTARFVPVESQNNSPMPSEAIFPEVMREILDFLDQGQGRGQVPTVSGSLTRREQEVLELLAQGKDNLQIAAHLGLSEKTVRNHITPIFDKLQVENRSQAIVKARDAGMGKV